LTCKEFIDFLMEYLGDALPPEERAQFEHHLGECPACVAYLDMYKKAVAIGKAACSPGCDDLPADVPADLVRAILAVRPGRPGSSPA
jgi:anti-sigma factor RsiW